MTLLPYITTSIPCVAITLHYEHHNVATPLSHILTALCSDVLHYDITFHYDIIML